MKDLLEIKNISLIYQTLNDEITAVQNLSFNVSEGEFVSVIGPSGCGKTTILSMIAGLLQPTEGEILFDGNKVKRDGIGYMLQKDHLFPWRNIERNVFLPLEIKKRQSEKDKEFAYSLLKKYGLYEFRNNYPDQLSGGMRQRVALIRTLVSDPKLLLLDEPFSALDSQTRLRASDDVYNIIKTERKTTVLVTHDISEAIAMSDKIIVLTNRPAQVKSIVYPNIKKDTPHKRRESPEFGLCFEKLWKELN